MAPRTYQYDGTLDGLLTASAHALDDATEPADFLTDRAVPDLFASPLVVATDPEQAAALLRRLEKVDPDSIRTVLHAFLSEESDIGCPIHTYMRLTLARGESIDGYLTHPHVRRVVMTARRVGGEAHRLKGLLRFRELRSGLLWAPVEPDANVVVLLALHFRRRLSGQHWLIHDLKRQVAVAWDGHKLEWLEGEGLRGRLAEVQPDALSAAETGYQELWKTFFRSIAIPERINPELQRRNMPRRYWKHLVEK